ASRFGRSPKECASPSTSTANRASPQKKSRTYGPVGCCRRNLRPLGRFRSHCHSITSGSVILRRNCRAFRVVRGGGFGAMSFSVGVAPPPRLAPAPSPRPTRGGFFPPPPPLPPAAPPPPSGPASFVVACFCLPPAP